MNTATVYCPACDKQAHLASTAAPAHPGQASLPDAPEVVCLSFGRRCAGGRCHLTGVPSVVMGARLARSGLTPEEGWRTIRMRCDACGRTSGMMVLDNVTAYCPECGSANRWFRAEAGDGACLPGPGSFPA